ncbi:MAG TPA: hypothetical protein VFB12_05700 [Ktedonobacteraceae bacterium]|nr:hypothetical protein [Ktedonobacteraceae bacterium]
MSSQIPGLEARMKAQENNQGKLHARVEELSRDMLESFQKQVESQKQFEQVVDARFSEVDARFDKVDARFSEVDARFDKVDARFSEVDARFDKVESRLDTIEASMATKGDIISLKDNIISLTNNIISVKDDIASLERRMNDALQQILIAITSRPPQLDR